MWSLNFIGFSNIQQMMAEIRIIHRAVVLSVWQHQIEKNGLINK